MPVVRLCASSASCFPTPWPPMFPQLPSALCGLTPSLLYMCTSYFIQPIAVALSIPYPASLWPGRSPGSSCFSRASRAQGYINMKYEAYSSGEQPVLMACLSQCSARGKCLYGYCSSVRCVCEWRFGASFLYIFLLYLL